MRAKKEKKKKGRKKLTRGKKELTEIIQRYEAAKAEKQKILLGGRRVGGFGGWLGHETKIKVATGSH